jgi:oxygen-independent coproporphyrinogen-3 oxidase
MTGIYIAFPFCLQKCTYCHFASGLPPREGFESYLDALLGEIDQADFPSPPDTLYLGGGTPSLMETADLARILTRLGVSEWREATIEAAPGTVTSEKAAGWARLGINRVSLGVQSFVPREAAAAGRKHTPEQVEAEIALLARKGIRNVNIDLLAGLAHQTEAGWRTSLAWVERLQPAHVSVYMLEVDDDSRLGQELRRGGTRFGAGETPAEDQITDFYLMAVDRLRRNSILQYEISNFARPGEESLHNLKYWNMDPYLGFGADAHSFDGRERWGNVSSHVEYVERRRRGESLRAHAEVLDGQRRVEDRFLTGLRRTAGFDASPEDLVLFEGALQRLAEKGWLERPKPGRLRLTPQGILFSNEVFQEFLPSAGTESREGGTGR